MKIYTSYFAKEKKLKENGIVPIGISIWPPKFYFGAHLKYLAPKRYMMSDNVTREQYTQMYFRDVLGVLNPERVIADIERISNGKDVALLCYEKPEDFCHRHLFAQWITEQTGVEVNEWGVVKNEAVDGRNTVEELSLFDGLL